MRDLRNAMKGYICEHLTVSWDTRDLKFSSIEMNLEFVVVKTLINRLECMLLFFFF